jgi:hypothetical protein
MRTALAAWRQPRQFAVYRADELLGRTDLPAVRPDRTGASGRFFPETSFYRYHTLFFRFRRALDQDSAKLAACVAELRTLGLSLWQETTRLDATIEMVSPWGRNTWVIHVRSSDPRIVGTPPL